MRRFVVTLSVAGVCCALGAGACSSFGSDDTPGGGPGGDDSGSDAVSDAAAVMPTDGAVMDADANASCKAVMANPQLVASAGLSLVDFDVDDTGTYWALGGGSGKIAGLVSGGTDPTAFGDAPDALTIAVTTNFIAFTAVDQKLHAFPKGFITGDLVSGSGITPPLVALAVGTNSVAFTHAVNGVPDGGSEIAECDGIVSNCMITSDPATAAPTFMVAYGSHLFYAVGSQITALTVGGNGTLTLAAGGVVTALGVDSTGVYFTDDGHNLRVAPLSFAPAQTIGRVTGTPKALVVGSKDVYIAIGAGIEVLPKAGGCAGTRVVNDPVKTLRYHGGSVYYSLGIGTILRFPEQ